MHYVGSCLCGAVRYEARSDPIDAGYCHCTMCQKISGAPVLAWASFREELFSYTSGKPRVYRSSPHGQREFCANCGSQIAFRSVDPGDTVEINMGTLDEPERLAPQYHIWCDSRISWFDTSDELPRFPKSERHPG